MNMWKILKIRFWRHESLEPVHTVLRLERGGPRVTGSGEAALEVPCTQCPAWGWCQWRPRRDQQPERRWSGGVAGSERAISPARARGRRRRVRARATLSQILSTAHHAHEGCRAVTGSRRTRRAADSGGSLVGRAAEISCQRHFESRVTWPILDS